MGGKHYPPPAYDYRIITSWYRLLKSESQCLTCAKDNVDLPAPIEYHHIDRATKCDTLSNMVYCRAPLGIIMAETMKCAPLCQLHHTDYHKHERDAEFIYEHYNFKGDKTYKAAINEFHAMAWLLSSPVMQQKYIDYRELKHEICHPRPKPLAVSPVSYRAL